MIVENMVYVWAKDKKRLVSGRGGRVLMGKALSGSHGVKHGYISNLHTCVRRFE
jgi:hypothetical protein